MVKLKNLP